MTHPRSRRGAALEALALAAVFFLSFALFYRLTLRPSSDISIHATWAAEGNFADLTSFLHHGAHPMWHVLVALVLRLGVPLAHAAALVTAACKTAEVWLIRRLMGRALPDRSPAALTGLALCVGTVSSLLTPYNPTVYLGVGTPNTWHSPTQMIAMVWMLICVPLTARCYDRFEAALPDPRANIPWREGALLGALLLLSLTAKPTFMQAFLPAACLFFLVAVGPPPAKQPLFPQGAGLRCAGHRLHDFAVHVLFRHHRALPGRYGAGDLAGKAGPRPAQHAADAGVPPVCAGLFSARTARAIPCFIFHSSWMR